MDEDGHGLLVGGEAVTVRGRPDHPGKILDVHRLTTGLPVRTYRAARLRSPLAVWLVAAVMLLLAALIFRAQRDELGTLAENRFALTVTTAVSAIATLGLMKILLWRRRNQRRRR